MRVTQSNGDVSVKAYAGSTGVLLAFNTTARVRRKLLGFTVSERRGDRPLRPLATALPWQGDPVPAPGTRFFSNSHPIQKFRWSDYTVEPGRTYTYEVAPMFGDPLYPTWGDAVAISATTESVIDGGHRVAFNRAAAASQAFSREFPNIDQQIRDIQAANAAAGTPNAVTLPPEALTWLTRNVLPTIVEFLRRAVDDTWSLSIAIYEYELEAITDEVEAARANGAEVRVLYHAKPNDPQTAQNEAALAGIPKSAKKARHPGKLMHDKFVVLSKLSPAGTRQAVGVLCGTTNWTENGVYRQANVVHTINDRTVARTYLELFDVLWVNPVGPAAARSWIDQNNPVTFSGDVSVGFSPRSLVADPPGARTKNLYADLTEFAAIIDAARRDVLFATAFDLHPTILAALLGRPHDDILRLGTQNSHSEITGFHRDRTALFATAALLDRGIEGFLKESYAGQRGGIHIHLKSIVTDFTSDKPTVISGSHNLSGSASEGNDENYLVIHGHPDIADVYGVELMRIYDHYRYRYVSQTRSRPPRLRRDSSWTDDYFTAGTLAEADRRRFGTPV